jgi:integrase
MAPRKRHSRNAALPDGLRVRDGVFSYRSRLDGREIGLGRDRKNAIAFARTANAEVERLKGHVDAAAWVRGETGKRTWGAWLDRYQQLLDARPLSPKTRLNYRDMMKKARDAFPAERDFSTLDVADFAGAVQPLVDDGKTSTAKSYRQWLIDCVRESMADGWRKDNPAEATRRVDHTVMRARLELEVLLRVYAAAKQPWLRNSIALALVSGQRREDALTAKRADVRDGHWWVEQGKTKSRVAIPLTLRLDAFGMSLGDVIKQCNSTGVLSHYLIHQTRQLEHSPRGGVVHPASVTRGFQDAVKSLGIDWGDNSPPSFHEIRSLSKRLYDAQGGVNTKQLLGHKSTASSDKYQDARGAWVKVSVK